MGVLLEFDIDGTRVSRDLGVMASGIKNFGKPLREISGDLMKTFDLNFAERGAIYGGWAERKKSYDWPILERTGQLRAGFRDRVTSTVLRIYNPVEYFKYHQSPSARSSNLPRRVMMALRRQDATMIQKTFQRHIIDVLRKRGLR
jgi:phage gpG-like protein